MGSPAPRASVPPTESIAVENSLDAVLEAVMAALASSAPAASYATTVRSHCTTMYTPEPGANAGVPRAELQLHSTPPLEPSTARLPLVYAHACEPVPAVFDSQPAGLPSEL